MLKQLRDQIDWIDSEIVVQLGRRIQMAREIARIKKREGTPILDLNRETEIKANMRGLAKEQGISPLVVEEIIQLILDYTRIEMEIL